MSCNACDFGCSSCDISDAIDSAVDDEFMARFTAQCPCAAEAGLPKGECVHQRCAHCQGTGMVLPEEAKLDVCRACEARMETEEVTVVGHIRGLGGVL